MSEPANAVPAPSDSPQDVSLLADDLHVVYRVYEERRPRLKDLVLRGFQARAYREIHAVKGVSFSLRTGEALGVIGPNGSGKSTLLRALAGLHPPTQGAVYARHRPSLLGVGAVLNSSLSGRRNVLLGGLALGLSRKEVNERYDDIVSFAGLEDFIDLPMRTYSSGMKARLHFAIATAVAPEILLIDEVLAVGDKDFRRRSRRRLREIRERAGTIVLVSHNLGEIRQTCTRAIWLEKGRVMASGDPGEVAAAYGGDSDSDED